MYRSYTNNSLNMRFLVRIQTMYTYSAFSEEVYRGCENPLFAFGAGFDARLALLFVLGLAADISGCQDITKMLYQDCLLSFDK